MRVNQKDKFECAICKKSFAVNKIISGALVRDSVSQVIRSEHPEWSTDVYICRNDLSHYRGKYVQILLESEKGELSILEEEVLKSIEDQQLITTDIDTEFEDKRTLGERIADRIAEFGGSWTFLIVFGCFVIVWIIINSLVLYWRPPDPYPYILLNLLLSCLAAIQAPIIMMSQNRQEAKDRMRSQHDYQINLKAELEIRHLHEKVDHLLSRQWERLVQIQEIQFDMLRELEMKS